MTEWDALNEAIIACRRCPRLAAYTAQVAQTRRRAYRDQVYWGKPVPGFGDPAARVLVVGLAPGAHGSNRTGRMFTGDASGQFLYAALHRAGFASQPESRSREDGLVLKDIFISAVCRCAPPDNKPLPAEITNCLPYLQAEMRLLDRLAGIVALGRVGFEGVLRLYKEAGNPYPPVTFGHASFFPGDAAHPWLLASYHPSQQNTQTGRLTAAMFDAIWTRARIELA